jgi:transcriptional regulator NrdR family protein
MNTATQQPNPNGIRCPHCGCCHFYTTHTEPLRDGRIRRRKRCRHCGRRIVTYEAAIQVKTSTDR